MLAVTRQPSRYNRIYVSLAISALFGFSFLSLRKNINDYLPDYGLRSAQPPSPSGPGPRNETLGFGAIYVLAVDDSTWRVQGLIEAAKLTGLSLTIPIQRRPSEEEVLAHLAGKEPGQNSLDSSRAVLGYISLLEEYLRTSSAETALFVEDDVDFSVDIKSQMEIFSQAMQTHFGGNANTDMSSEADENASNLVDPYRSDNWDILWLGHSALDFTSETEIFEYSDAFAMPWSKLHADWNNYYQQRKESGRVQQQLARNVAPIGSYAWAITRSHAQRLVQRIRDEHWPQFDMELHIDCQGLVQRCFAPVPELLHHQNVVGSEKIGDLGNVDDGKQDLDWWRDSHKYTYNVEWSARCSAAGSGEKLGDRWQCLPGRYDDRV